MGGKDEKPLVGRAGKAAVGLAAAAAAAYGVYLWGRPRARRRPVTELAVAFNLPLQYVPWRSVHYAYYTRPGTGRPIILLHAVSAISSAHEMRPLLQRLLPVTDRPIYVLEWLGFGHSDRPEIEYDPELLEGQLEHFLSRVVQPRDGVDIIGYSVGAGYAAEVARRRADLVRTLVAIEPTGLGAEPPEIGKAWARLLFTLPGVQEAFYDRLTTPEALYNFARDNLFSAEYGVPQEYIDYGSETARVEGASRPLDDFLNGNLFPDDPADTIQHLSQPLLVIHGTVADRRLESYTELPTLSQRPNTRVVALPTGALPHWERPGEVTEKINGFYADFEGAVPRKA
ncbi:MAG: alpha/beta hydrolase [Gemmatimonadota bacterium]|jgi:pimeloyl-ACP methyl ester carboxylesterase|nr:alpha/beta hydrolase [Gemmatimonadota bacterium]